MTVAEMDDFRWLVVGPPGQPDVGIVLMDAGFRDVSGNNIRPTQPVEVATV